MIVLLLAGCVPDGPADPEPSPTPTSSLSLLDWSSDGPSGVGVTTLVLEDASRETPAHGEEPALPTRQLEVEVWYPAEAGGATQAFPGQPVVGAGLPLLLWSHGFLSDRLDHTGLGQFLASHGYVVASIGYPLSGRGAPGGADPADVVNQPGDVSFVLDALLAEEGLLSGAVDAESFVGAAGLSLGGMTTALVGLHPAVLDDRLDALIPVAPATCSLGVEVLETEGPPTLIIHGDGDAVLPFDEHAQVLFDGMQGARWLARLVGGTHTGFPDLTAELFDGLDHADSVGCGQISDAIAEGEAVTVDPVDEVGDVLGPDCPVPCEDLEGYGEGMRPTRQVTLLKSLMHAFLDGVALGDAEGTLWIEAGVGLQEADVEVSAG